MNALRSRTPPVLARMYCIAVLAVIAAAAGVAVQAVLAAPSTKMEVVPAVAGLMVGQEQDVAIWARNIPSDNHGLGAYQLLFRLNGPGAEVIKICNGGFISPDSLTCVSSSSSFLGSTGRPVTCTTTESPTEAGIACFTIGAVPPQPGGKDGPSGDGLLAVVRIRGVSENIPGIPITLEAPPEVRARLLDPSGTIDYLADGTVSGGSRKIVECPDLNGDGRVFLSDVVQLSLIWGQRPGDAGWEADANGNGIKDGEERDLDQDGRIFLGDIVIIAITWSQWCP